MDLRVQQASVTEIETPLLVVNLFEGVTTARRRNGRRRRAPWADRSRG